MTDQEQADLDAMRLKSLEIKVQTWDFMLYMIRDSTILAHSGHKSVGDALVHAMKSSEKKVDALQAEYIRLKESQ